jgi:hypothetical protein
MDKKQLGTAQLNTTYYSLPTMHESNTFQQQKQKCILVYIVMEEHIDELLNQNDDAPTNSRVFSYVSQNDILHGAMRTHIGIKPL